MSRLDPFQPHHRAQSVMRHTLTSALPARDLAASITLCGRCSEALSYLLGYWGSRTPSSHTSFYAPFGFVMRARRTQHPLDSHLLASLVHLLAPHVAHASVVVPLYSQATFRFVKMLALGLVSILGVFTVAFAQHTFTLVNNCGYTVPLYIDSWPGSVDYTGPQPTLGAGQTTTVSIPSGWNSRICDNADGGKCWGQDSMTEYNMDSGGLNYYDISNIEAFSIAQAIYPADGSCDAVVCTDAGCPCSDAYPVGDESGCGDDAPVKACGDGDFTITYCP